MTETDIDGLRVVKADGIELLSVVAGSGPRLLVLGGSNADLRKATSAQNTAFVDHFEVLTFDPRGLGRSSKPDIVYTMADYANDARTVMDAHGWHRAHVLGISFGGMVAQEFAIRFPDMVDRLVLNACASGGAGGSSYPIEEFVGLPPHERARKALAVFDTAFTEEWIAANPQAAEARIEATIAGMSRFADEPDAAVGKARQLAARSTHDTYDRLGEIRAKTLVLAGDRDGQALVEHQRTLADGVSDSEFALLAGGHGVLFENPDGIGTATRFLRNE